MAGIDLRGSLLREECDAIVVFINSKGEWVDGTSDAVGKLANKYYHQKLAEIVKLKGVVDGQIVVVSGNKLDHLGKFNDIIFVVDDYLLPYADMVYSIFKCAEQRNYSVISFPTMHRSNLEGDFCDDTLGPFLRGLDRFVEESLSNLMIYTTINVL